MNIVGKPGGTARPHSKPGVKYTIILPHTHPPYLPFPLVPPLCISRIYYLAGSNESGSFDCGAHHTVASMNACFVPPLHYVPGAQDNAGATLFDQFNDVAMGSTIGKAFALPLTPLGDITNTPTTSAQRRKPKRSEKSKLRSKTIDREKTANFNKPEALKTFGIKSEGDIATRMQQAQDDAAQVKEMQGQLASQKHPGPWTLAASLALKLET